jgi:uncharacterized protein YxjI
MSNPAGWFPDPYGRHELRYWTGADWTEHVSSHGRQNVDAPEGPQPTVTGTATPDRIAGQVRRHAEATARAGGSAATWQGSGHLLDEPLLVVNQKAKIIEVNAEYAVYDGAGTQIGAVRQVGQSALKKFVRVFSSADQFMTHTYQVVDATGNVVMGITRPRKFVKSRVVVTDGLGEVVGEARQENAIGKIRFGLYGADDARVGTIRAENWRAWNFDVVDAADESVARMTKTWEGLAKTLFTTADNYVVQIHRPLADPLRTLVVAAALTVDTALKQDSRGFS